MLITRLFHPRINRRSRASAIDSHESLPGVDRVYNSVGIAAKRNRSSSSRTAADPSLKRLQRDEFPFFVGLADEPVIILVRVPAFVIEPWMSFRGKQTHRAMFG